MKRFIRGKDLRRDIMQHALLPKEAQIKAARAEERRPGCFRANYSRQKAALDRMKTKWNNKGDDNEHGPGQPNDKHAGHYTGTADTPRDHRKGCE